ncbi:MAG: DegT/DnrJ/EryC1/StrS family aminotransferase, partial [Shimia sp.]
EPQIALIGSRAENGRRNHDHMAGILNATPYFHVPPALRQETRAPDSIQFLLCDFSEAQARGLVQALKARHMGAQVFGLSENNARAFWNWQFLPEDPGPLPRTRAMLERACDLRLPARLSLAEVEVIAAALIEATEEVLSPPARLSA